MLHVKVQRNANAARKGARIACAARKDARECLRRAQENNDAARNGAKEYRCYADKIFLNKVLVKQIKSDK